MSSRETDDVFGMGTPHGGTCENCKSRDVLVRRVRSAGSDFGGGSRGNFNICYDCFGHHVKHNRGRKIFYTPKRKK